MWAAVNDQSPYSVQQRCRVPAKRVHKTMNVLDKLPKDEQPMYRPRLRAIWQADGEKAARKLAAAVVCDLREAGYDRAADFLADDLDRLSERWRCLKSAHLCPTVPLPADTRKKTKADAA